MILNYEKYDFTPPWEKRTPVVLIHGLGADNTTWFYQTGELVKYFPVVALDLPGFGKSRLAEEDLTIEYMGKCVYETIKSTGAVKAHIAGISLGSFVSLEVATAYPDMVDKLVLISAPYTFINENIDENMKLVESYSHMNLAEVAKERISHAFSSGGKKEAMDFLGDIIGKSDPNVYIASATSVLKYYSHEKYSKVKAKTLILNSELDYLAPPCDAEKINNAIGGSKKVILKQTGHASCLDNPLEVNKELIKFLNN
jgi:3-oxoadipate enol-lactonase